MMLASAIFRSSLLSPSNGGNPSNSSTVSPSSQSLPSPSREMPSRSLLSASLPNSSTTTRSLRITFLFSARSRTTSLFARWILMFCADCSSCRSKDRACSIVWRVLVRWYGRGERRSRRVSCWCGVRSTGGTLFEGERGRRLLERRVRVRERVM